VTGVQTCALPISNIKLGDVVIGSAVRFDCTTKFKNETFAKAEYRSSTLPPDTFAAVTPALLKPNADRLKDENAQPLKMVYGGSPTTALPKVVTTDFFAYDDSADTYHLQALGNVCEMGDAVLGLVLGGSKTAPNPAGPQWVAIRNASDGQMDATLPKKERDAKAGQIYMRYGIYTTAGSVLASWAVIRELVPAAKQPAPAGAMVAAATPKRRVTPAPTANEVLLALAASRQPATTDIARNDVPTTTLQALSAALANVNVSEASSDISFRRLSFTDELGTAWALVLAQVSNDDTEAFRGSYLFDGASLVAKHEVVSG